jgi:4-amino-4-deoxy-L-arabinose transferase-like glycosyltransferase
MEFPAQPFLTGVLFKVFGAREPLTLVISLLVGIGLVFVTYLIACRTFDRVSGIIAGAIVAVAPTLTFQTVTGLWPDPPMIFFAVLGLYFVVRWEAEDRWIDLAAGVGSIALAVLLKLTALFIGPPVLYVLVRKYGASWWRMPLVWIAGTSAMLPPVMWYWHAYGLYQECHNTFGILGPGYLKFGDTSLLTSLQFYRQTAFRIAAYHLTPLSAVGFIAGAALVLQRKLTLLLVWFVSVSVYIVVVARGVAMGHYQYALPALPIGAVIAGGGLSSMLERLTSLPAIRARRWASFAAVAAAVLLFSANSAFAARLFEQRDRISETQVWLLKKRTGVRVGEVTRPGSLIVVVDTQMDDRTPATSMTPPDVFYFADRRGWYSSMAWLTEEKIEDYRNRGAGYLVVSGQSVSSFREERADLDRYLATRYAMVMDDADGIVFNLRESPP